MKKADPATSVSRSRRDWSGDFGAVSPPLWSSDTFRWEDEKTKPGYDYSRTVNPNRDMLVELLSELEGAAGGVATGSGQSAALLALLILPADALVIAPHDCYGGTYRLLQGLRDQRRIRAAFIDMRDEAQFEAALGRGPALVWFETPSNPLLRVVDLGRWSARAREAGALTLCDNTLLTPILQRPLDLGCGLVMHSTTKALNGHADLFGGALLAADPSLVERMHWWSNAAGLNGSAHDAWQIVRGMRTLPLRVTRQQESAGRLAEWLQQRPEILEVHYPGLAAHPDHEIATAQQQGPGFMLSFRLRSGDDGASAFIRRLELITLASSLGGFSTLVCQPSSMTHRGMPPAAQKEAGIHPDLLRLSVGLEEPVDLIADLERALDAAA